MLETADRQFGDGWPARLEACLRHVQSRRGCWSIQVESKVRNRLINLLLFCKPLPKAYCSVFSDGYILQNDTGECSYGGSVSERRVSTQTAGAAGHLRSSS